MRGLLPARDEALTALLAGVLFALAFPPVPLVAPAFFCLVPLAVFAARRADANRAVATSARMGLWFGVVGYGLTLYWIAVALSLYTRLAIAGYIASIVWLAPFVALTCALLQLARKSTKWPMAILLPVVWVALEVTLNHLADLAFPWLPLGLSVAKVPMLAQIADLSGVRGVSFWIAATNGLIADVWLVRDLPPLVMRGTARRRVMAVQLATALAMFVVVATYGRWRLATTELHPLATVAAIQPNIPEDVKLHSREKDRFVGVLDSLTRDAHARRKVDLVVWPETALPDFLTNHADWLDSLRALGDSVNTPILFGTLDATFHPDGSGFDYFNAAMITDKRGFVSGQPPYHKEYLVPVVERVPFVNPKWFAGLQYFGGFGRGDHPLPFTVPFGKVGVLVCYESIFPQLSRYYRREGATMLVNITNDAWFQRSVAPWQHAAHISMRAIENRMPIVRAANTGISEYVDPLGRVHGATSIFTTANPVFDVQATNLESLYVLAGDWVGLFSFVATLALALLGWRRSRRERLGLPA